MDELVKQLQQKTGLAADQVKAVVEGVIDFLKDKLPAPIADQVAGFLEGNGAGDGGEGLMDKAKDMLGDIMGGGDS